MNIIDFYHHQIYQNITPYLEESGFSEPVIFSVAIPKNHGDFSTNIAMVLSRFLKKPARQIAENILPLIKNLPYSGDISIAGPGFINWNATQDLWYRILETILEQRQNYGVPQTKYDLSVNIEFISANPTGPLHIGHLRGAVFGDVLARLLKKIGHDVTREYYINDAGGQIDALARSLWFRYCALCGQKNQKPPDSFYPGDYLIDAALQLKERDGEKWLNQPESLWLEPIKNFSVKAMMALIHEDLNSMSISFDRFSSEKELIENGRVDLLIEDLKKRDLIYLGTPEKPKGSDDEKWYAREQWLFRSSQFGDDVDRPIYKKDNSLTYFASDIAYHHDKYQRGGIRLIDILGADHAGYTHRIAAATYIVCDKKVKLEALFCQLVKLIDNKKSVKMSKRGGSFIMLRDLIDSVGADALRFFMLMRKNDAPLDFDLNLVKQQNRDNPVFYVQYAHARCHSVFRMAENLYPDIVPDIHASSNFILSNDLKPLLRHMAFWPQLLLQAAERAEPHRVSFYLFDLAAHFHSLWTKGRKDSNLRFVDPENQCHTQACLGVIDALACILSSGLNIMGIEPVKEMKDE